MALQNIINAKSGKKIKLQGFVDSIRNKKSIAFIVLRDITGKIQITIVKEKSPQFNDVIEKITPESVITVTGTIKKNPEVKLNGIELLPSELVLESIAATPLPIDSTSLIDTRLDYRWIDLRSEKNSLVFKVQTLLTSAFRNFLLKKDFIEFHSPEIIATASESGSEVFELQYFDRKAYLAQSPQFYKQMALASGWEKVFCCAPVFRAEKSNTNKHATEFTGFDLEFTGVETVEDVMKMEENLLVEGIKVVNKKYGKEIERLFNIPLPVPTLPFPRMDLNEVYAELEKRYGYKVPEEEKGDLPTEGEKLCKQLAHDKFKHEFIFITGYDTKKRAFYHTRVNGVAQGYDLIWRGVEITTGAKREHRYDILLSQAKEKGLDKDVQFYLDFFKYGMPPHGGFGVGLDRITMLIFGLTIKEAQFVFRGPNRLNP